jgi:hypothetical protein
MLAKRLVNVYGSASSQTVKKIMTSTKTNGKVIKFGSFEVTKQVRSKSQSAKEGMA